MEQDIFTRMFSRVGTLVVKFRTKQLFLHVEYQVIFFSARQMQLTLRARARRHEVNKNLQI